MHYRHVLIFVKYVQFLILNVNNGQQRKKKHNTVEVLIVFGWKSNPGLNLRHYNVIFLLLIWSIVKTA